MPNIVTVLCEIKDCIYHLHNPKEGEAYQDQCGNDEIEIAEFSSSTHVPACYTYKRKPKGKAVRKGERTSERPAQYATEKDV